MSQESKPEIFIGLAAPLGTDSEQLCEEIEQALVPFAYTCEQISLIQTAPRLTSLDGPLKVTPLDEAYESKMNAGDAARSETGRYDILALGALLKIREARGLIADQKRPLENTAYILKSLKNTYEVDLCRRVYGDSFVLIGGFMPKARRVENLAERFAQSRVESLSQKHRTKAEELIERDTRDQESSYGQRLADTFATADVIVGVGERNSLRRDLNRFFEVYFGCPRHTPTRDEYGMYMAYAASLRSGALSRQVGAAITDDCGEVVALGLNEVPRAGGGVYWPSDSPDERDLAREMDPGRADRLAVAMDLARRAGKRLAADLDGVTQAEVNDALGLTEDLEKIPDWLRSARVMSLIEFNRVLHAEMHAITQAAQRGVPLRGLTLYTTTFPCHDCARHIIASGLSRVVYIEPYPKSLAIAYHNDSIDVDGDCYSSLVSFQPFVGIAPSRYQHFYRFISRRGEDSNLLKWNPFHARPRAFRSHLWYIDSETNELAELAEFDCPGVD
jgi:cytidine deaminase